MGTEFRTNVLCFRNCELTISQSFLARGFVSPPNRDFRRGRRCLALSELRSSITDSDIVGEDVMRIFLKERQLHGDFISKSFDLVWRRNDLKFDELETAGTVEETSQQFDDYLQSEINGGYLKLATTRNWITGTSNPPANKKLSAKDRQNESEKRKKLNLLKYEALKGEILLLTVGIGAACSVYCLLNLSLEAAVSYAGGVLFSCLYLQLLYRHTDTLSKEDIPEIFMKRKSKNKIGITSEDVKTSIKKILGGTTVALLSPRLVVPAAVYGLWAFSQHFHNDYLNFQLVPGVMGFFAYKAAALVQAYRDNEELRMIFPEEEGYDSN